MISRKTLTGLMLGASVSALVLAATPGGAFDLSGTFNRDVACPVDFPCILDELEIQGDFSTTGNVIIDGLIGVGGEDEPLEVEDDAVIGGALIISPTGQVSAWDADAGNEAEAEATAVTIDSDEAPRFVNNGVVEAEAEADAAGGLLFDAEADADAKGIEHDGEELAEDINNGLIDVDATATAISIEVLGLTANAEAESEAVGIDQYVNGDDGEDGPSSTARAINGVDGVIEVESHATAVVEGEDKVGEAEAEAIGIEQTVDDNDVALAEHTNDGLVLVSAEAIAKAEDAEADADATGLNQEVDGDSSATASFVNNGTFIVSAEASVREGDDEVEDGDAEAEALAVNQEAEADNDGSIALATITNTSSLTLGAVATAFASGDDVEAEADAQVAEQDAEEADTATTEYINTGVTYANAYATVHFEDEGDADADAKTIDQWVDAEVTGNAIVTNAAGAELSASAFATAIGSNDDEGEEPDGDAEAEAIVISQQMDSDGTGTATVTNDGTIYAYASAFAASFEEFEELDGDAEADADATAVIQEVDAEDGTTATVSLINTSLLSLDATAFATASAEDADADADARVAEQDAEADVASTTVTNSGAMNAYAEANAYGGTDADADADAQVIDQWVDADTTGTATVTNPGGAVIGADAFAYAKVNDEEDDIEAEAEAEANAISQQVDSDGTGTATVTNDGEIYAFAAAQAQAFEPPEVIVLALVPLTPGPVLPDLNGEAEAEAEATTIIQEVDADEDGATTTATVSLTNFGLLPVDGGGSSSSSSSDHGGGGVFVPAVMNATAFATATGEEADADAFARVAEQDAEATNASTTVTNSGTMNAYAEANAFGEEEAEAEAEAQVIDQWIDADTTGTATVTNNVDAVIGADAFAYAQVGDEEDDIEAEAEAEANAISQQVESDGTGTATVTNDGEIHAFARAQAQSFEELVFPNAQPEPEPEAEAAEVVPVPPVPVLPDLNGEAEAEAEAVTNVQEVEADTAVINLTNVGLLVDGGSSSSSSSDHGGVVSSAQMFATAYATATGDEAEAEAEARIAEQDVEGITGTINVDNAGVMDAYAEANANGEEEAEAEAEASVIDQWFDTEEDGISNLTNRAGAVMSAEALANAVASGDAEDDGDAEAEAEAAVISIAGDADGSLILNLLNQGELLARAEANATGDGDEVAEAEAVGIEVRGVDGTPIVAETTTTGGSTTDEITSDDPEDGNGTGGGTTTTPGIINENLIDVVAIAHGAGDEEGPADADAVGIHLDGAQITGTVLNSGAIFVYAEAFDPGAGEAGAGEADAEGILITNEDEQEEIDETALLTIHNDAGAIVAEVADEEEDVGLLLGERGTAIDTEDAPNDVEILLTGNNPDGLGSAVASERISDFLNTVFGGQSFGYIYGDIEIDEDHEIVVTDGKTLFDGVINPEEDNDDGTLTIRDTGTLVMLQNEEEGPSDAHVDTFNLDDGGTLMVELTPEDDDVPGVEADIANINGRIFALYNPGFYDDETRYEDVVETEEGGLLVGDTFNVDDNSALLITEAQIDEENDSIDLVATRQGFGEVDGLSKNGKKVGDAIERIYGNLEDDDSLFSNNVKELFALADGDYQNFMDQLTGAEHAQYLQSVLWSTRTIKRTITERMECDAYGAGAVANVNGLQVRPTADLAPEAIGCFTPGTGHVWGRASGTWNSLDGDRNAPGYDETQISFTAGADYAFTDSFYAGIAGGWISSEMDFDNFGRRRGASVDYEGWHVAGYGGYDNRVFYLRGIVDFASYDGETHRDIKKGVTLIDPSSNEADSDVFNFYGEAGYRWEFSPDYTFTPFVGVDVGHAELDSFNEKDPHDTGWALKVKGGDADSVETLVGVRFGGFWDMAGGMFRPDVMVAWAHEFDDPAEVDMAFRDAPDAKFTVVASDVSDDSLVAGVGGTFDVTNQLRFGIKWDGRFNEDYDSNSVIGRIEYKF